MSVVVASGQIISDNILNHSSSKQMYSFPRQKRFHALKKSSSSTFFYNIPSKLSKRSTFIGYGQKSDFTNMRKFNAPYYNLRNSKDSTQVTSPKYTFGIARDYYQKVDVNGKLALINTISPGPGKYSYLKPFGSFGPKYTMRKRYSWALFEGKRNTPGPARYENNLKINSEGKYSWSRFTNTPRSVWSLSTTKRFEYNYPKTPGANAYRLENLINGNGSWYNSRYRSAVSNTISRKFKGLFDINSSTPGPGAYQTFSEFGIYRSKNADKFDEKVMAKTFNSTFYNNKKTQSNSRYISRNSSGVGTKANKTSNSFCRHLSGVRRRDISSDNIIMH